MHHVNNTNEPGADSTSEERVSASNGLPVRRSETLTGARRIAAILLVLAVPGALLAAGVLPRMQQADARHASASALHEPAAVPVIQPTHGAAEELRLPGTIEAIELTAVNARASGYVRRRLVDIGSRVQAGQLLAELESPEIAPQLEQARAEAARAVAAREQSRAELRRLEAAYHQARAEITRFEASVTQADADRLGAQSTVGQARAQTNRAQAAVEQGRAEVKRGDAAVEQARAALSRVEADVAEARQELARRRAEQARATTNLEIARKTSERWQALAKEGAVSQQEADERLSLRDARQAELEAAQSAVSAGQAKIDAALAAQKAARADIEAAQAGVGSNQASVRAAEASFTATESDVETAQAKVGSQKANIQVAQALVSASQANLQAARARVQAGQSDVSAAEANIKAAAANVRRFEAVQSFQRVLAPFAGVVTARNVDAGSLVNAGSSGTIPGGGSDAAATMRSGLFAIARTDVLRIQVNVPQTFVAGLRTGQRATVEVRELPSHPFTGEVFRLGGGLDPNARTLRAEIRVRNPEGRLLPGMYAQVHLGAGATSTALRVPSSAIVLGVEGPRVVTVGADSRVHFAKVELGRDFGKEVEVVSGLRGHERLIANPLDSLTEGAPVRAATAAEPPAH